MGPAWGSPLYQGEIPLYKLCRSTKGMVFELFIVDFNTIGPGLAILTFSCQSTTKV